MKYVIELSEKDFDNIKHAYTAIFGDIYYIMQGAIANGKALEQEPKMGHWIDAELKEKIQKYQSIHDSYCDNISKGDAWEGHTTDHYDLSSGKATACDVILGFINELQAESDE